MNALIVVSDIADNSYINKALSLFKQDNDMVFLVYLHREEDLFWEQKEFNTLLRDMRGKGWSIAGTIEKGNPLDGIENIVNKLNDTTVVVPKGDVPFQSFMTVSLEDALKKRMKAPVVSIHAVRSEDKKNT